MADKQKPGRKEARAHKPHQGNGVSGFDTWLESKLRTAYSSVLDEPIPDDLMNLISQKLKD